MKLWNVTQEQLEGIVTEVSNEQYGGNLRIKSIATNGKRVKTVTFTLTVNSSKEKGGRRSHSGRRVCACCWHGHRDVMQKIFVRFENARLQTALADYRGRDDFENSFESTGDKNIGSQFAPLAMRDACDC